MASGDGYKLDLQQADYLGQEVHNVFFWKQLTGTGGASALAQQFDDSILPLLAQMQSDGLAYVLINCLNIDDPGDFIEFDPVNTGGAVTGEDMPPFTATEFRYFRTTRAVRNGWKRFSGVTQPMMEAEALAAGFVTPAANLANALKQTLDDGVGNTWKPQIARRTVVAGVTTYTLFDVANVTFTRVTTQNSRKLGT